MLKNLSVEERKTLIIWLIVGIIFFLGVILFKVFEPSKKPTIDYSKEEYQIVLDHDRYYTVIGALSKYYSFLNANDYQSVLKILDATYVKDKQLSEDNIGVVITSGDYKVSYIPNIMCHKGIDQGITSYVIKGSEKNSNSSKVIRSQYYEVILDANNTHFSVKPIEEAFFKEVCDE